MGCRCITLLFLQPWSKIGRVVDARLRLLYPLERDPVAIVQVREWTSLDVCVENLDLPGFEPRAVQSVTSRYTDCVIQAHEYGVKVE